MKPNPPTAGPRRGILAAGHWIVDFVKRIDRWPEPATLARIEQQQVANGGFAFNLLSDLAALDAACPLFAAGLIGDDANGRFIRERCCQLKIDDALLRTTPDTPTSFTDVMTETKSGRRTFFYCPGANEQLNESHLRPLASTAKIFCLGYLGFLPLLDAVNSTDGLNGSARLLREARQAGMLTTADLVSAPNPNLRAQVAPCLPHLDILFLNEWEAGQLLGTASQAFTSDNAGELAKRVRKFGIRGVVVLHFPEGVVAAIGDDEYLAQGAVNLPDGEIQGTVGAGDALAAGVLLARHNEMSWPDALKLGVCAAAACLKSPTASDGLLPWQNCLELGHRCGFKNLA